MSDYGVTSAGFVGKSLETCLSEIKAELREAFGAGINLAPNSAFAKLAGILADREASIWELAEAIYLAFTPDGAAGAQQDNILALTGALRLDAKKSLVTCILVGDAGTTINAGKVAAVETSGARFVVPDDVTLEAVDAWENGHTYAEGDLVESDGAVWRAVAGGVAATAPDTDGLEPGDTFSSSTPDWLLLGDGDAAAESELEAEDTGPTPAAAGALTEIVTPVTGWSEIRNMLDAELGRDVETDPAARLRREELLSVDGSSVIDAIRSRVREVEDVEAAHVFENTTNAVDDEGLPPKSVEVLALGGDDDEVAQAIWDTKPAGIEAHGDTSGTAEDEEGDEHEVAFTRPEERDVYIIVPVLDTDDDLPDDAEDQIKAALVAFAEEHYGLGTDVVSSRLGAVVFDISGIVDVGDVKIGLAPAPGTSTTITNTLRQIARVDTSRISVTGLP